MFFAAYAFCILRLFKLRPPYNISIKPRHQAFVKFSPEFA